MKIIQPKSVSCEQKLNNKGHLIKIQIEFYFDENKHETTEQLQNKV